MLDGNYKLFVHLVNYETQQESKYEWRFTCIRTWIIGLSNKAVRVVKTYQLSVLIRSPLYLQVISQHVHLHYYYYYYYYYLN